MLDLGPAAVDIVETVKSAMFDMVGLVFLSIDIISCLI